MLTAIHHKDPGSSIHWLEIAERLDDEQYQTLKRQYGWRWGGKRKMFLTNSRWPRYPDFLEVTEGEDVDFAAERAERLEDRAASASARSTASLAKAHAIGDHIPFGQPILVGHHSEGRHRRDLGKIDSNMRAFAADFDKAKDLAERAESSRRHQAAKERPGALQRRIDTLAAEQRAFLRDYANSPKTPAYLERQQWYDDEIAAAQAKLDATGGLPFDRLGGAVGDTVWYKGHSYVVTKVHAKSVQAEMIDGLYLPDCFRHKCKLEKSAITDVIKPGQAAPAAEEATDTR